MAKKDQLCATEHEEKMNVEGFTQNNCFGNQSHPFQVLI